MRAIWTWIDEWDGGWNSKRDEIIKEEVDILQYIMVKPELPNTDRITRHESLCAVCNVHGKIKLISVEDLKII